MSAEARLSVGVLALGTTSILFVEPVVNVDRYYQYRIVLLMQKRLPDIRRGGAMCLGATSVEFF